MKPAFSNCVEWYPQRITFSFFSGEEGAIRASSRTAGQAGLQAPLQPGGYISGAPAPLAPVPSLGSGTSCTLPCVLLSQASTPSLPPRSLHSSRCQHGRVRGPRVDARGQG